MGNFLNKVSDNIIKSLTDNFEKLDYKMWMWVTEDEEVKEEARILSMIDALYVYLTGTGIYYEKFNKEHCGIYYGSVYGVGDIYLNKRGFLFDPESKDKQRYEFDTEKIEITNNYPGTYLINDKIIGFSDKLDKNRPLKLNGIVINGFIDNASYNGQVDYIYFGSLIHTMPKVVKIRDIPYIGLESIVNSCFDITNTKYISSVSVPEFPNITVNNSEFFLKLLACTCKNTWTLNNCKCTIDETKFRVGTKLILHNSELIAKTPMNEYGFAQVYGVDSIVKEGNYTVYKNSEQPKSYDCKLSHGVRLLRTMKTVNSILNGLHIDNPEDAEYIGSVDGIGNIYMSDFDYSCSCRENEALRYEYNDKNILKKKAKMAMLGYKNVYFSDLGTFQIVDGGTVLARNVDSLYGESLNGEHLEQENEYKCFYTQSLNALGKTIKVTEALEINQTTDGKFICDGTDFVRLVRCQDIDIEVRMERDFDSEEPFRCSICLCNGINLKIKDTDTVDGDIVLLNCKDVNVEADDSVVVKVIECENVTLNGAKV